MLSAVKNYSSSDVLRTLHHWKMSLKINLSPADSLSAVESAYYIKRIMCFDWPPGFPALFPHAEAKFFGVIYWPYNKYFTDPSLFG